MASRLLALFLVCLPFSDAVALRVGTPSGRISIETQQEPSLDGQRIDTVVLHLEPWEIDEDFAGVGGFRFALRVRPEAILLSFAIPEGSQGSFLPSDDLPGWYDFLIDVAVPVQVEDGRVPLVEVRTLDLDAGSYPTWVGPAVQIVASPQSEFPGWITWRESARTGACSDSDPGLRPCVRLIDRIDRRLRFMSDRLVTFVPDIVVSPGERFMLPVNGRLLSILALLDETDLDHIETTTSWDATQFDLVGARLFRSSAVDTFHTRIDYIPPTTWDNLTESYAIHALEFEARDDATGSTVFMGPYSSGLGEWTRTVDEGLHGSIRVVDCTPMDVDDDRRVSTADAVEVLLRSARNQLSSDGFTAHDLCTGDIDRDGTLEAGDATRVLRAVVGLDRQADTLGVVSSRLERDGDRILLRVDGSAAADVVLGLDGATWGGALAVSGGTIATAALGGRAAISLAAPRVEDHVVELELRGEGRITIVSARDGEGAELEFDPTPVSLRAPDRFLGAFPNPFNPSTELLFVVDRPGTVRLDIHDASGRRVRTIVTEANAGESSVTWNGTDDAGHEVATGVYHVRMRCAEGTSSGRITLLK